MKLKILILCLCLSCMCAYPQSKKNANYGTKGCQVLVEKANNAFNKKNYEAAKVLYQEALATGDQFYAKKCQQMLTQCNSYLAGKNSGKNSSKAGATLFTISQDTIKVNYLGGEHALHVDGTNWTATIPEGEDWCHIAIDKKKGLIYVYTNENQSPDSRNAVITVKNGDGKKKTVEIVNEGAPVVLRSSAQNLLFTPSGETNIVDIDSNTEWTLGDVPSWLQAIKGRNDIQFTATANNKSEDRTAQVKVETPNDKQIIINIIQTAGIDSLAFSKNDLNFGPEGGVEYIHVFTDAKDWRFGSFPYWCQLERVNDNTIRVRCTPNEPVDMPREASINVTNGSQTLGINVFQEPKPIVHIIPTDGIGGRPISFGFSAGYVLPMISAKSGSVNTFSAVNYGQGTDVEKASYSSSGGISIEAYADIRLYKNLYLKAGVNFLWYKYDNKVEGMMETIFPSTSQYYLKGKGIGSFKEDYSVMSLDVPVLVSYRIPMTRQSHLRINAGPVLDLGLGTDLNLAGNFDSDEMRLYKIVNGIMTDDEYSKNKASIHSLYRGKFDMYTNKATLKESTSNGLNTDFDELPQQFKSAPFSRVNFGLRFGMGYEWMGISLDISYQWMLTNTANKNFWDGDRLTVFSNTATLMKGYSQHNNLLLVTVGYTFRY